LDGYDPNKKEMDLETKKLMLNLLFKNIKIAPAIGGALPQKRISFSLFAPFSRLWRDPATAGNFLFSETEKKLQCQKNQKLIKICPKKSTSVPSDDRWCKYRVMILGILKRLSDCESKG